MKKITKLQIDEVNELLTDHAEALTAFYDEALHDGMINGILVGTVISFGAAIICRVVLEKKRHPKKKSESRNRDSFLFRRLYMFLYEKQRKGDTNG